jgi:adenine phosphoribosyltransferase
MLTGDKMMSLKQVVDLMRDVPDFPKPGIVFKDITPILESSRAFQSLILHFRESIPFTFDKLLAIESRGFILGAALAQVMDVGLVLVRKAGKLPGETVSFRYDLEYGSDTLEIHKDSVMKGERVLIIDDVLATGGTAHAVERLCESLGAEVMGHRFFLELSFLHGRERLKKEHKSLCVI